MAAENKHFFQGSIYSLISVYILLLKQQNHISITFTIIGSTKNTINQVAYPLTHKNHPQTHSHEVAYPQTQLIKSHIHELETTSIDKVINIFVHYTFRGSLELWLPPEVKRVLMKLVPGTSYNK
jgi:hypothetical protein